MEIQHDVVAGSFEGISKNEVPPAGLTHWRILDEFRAFLLGFPS